MHTKGFMPWQHYASQQHFRHNTPKTSRTYSFLTSVALCGNILVNNYKGQRERWYMSLYTTLENISISSNQH